jgi:Ca2+-binding RTX toxin-like protein
MIIDVQSTKNDAKEDAGNPYGFTEEKPSRKPFVIGGLLTGLALYLKSVFPGWGGTQDAMAAPVGEPDEAEEAPQVAQMATDNILPLLLDPGAVATPQLGLFGLTGSGGRLVDLTQPARFLTVDGDDLLLVEVTPPAVEMAAPHALLQPQLRFANDNPSPGGGGGGVSAGGKTPLQELIDEIIGGPVEDTDDDLEEDDDTTDPDEDEDDDDDEVANRAPRVTGPVTLHDVFGCAAVVIGLSELLRNATDPDGDALTIKNLTVSSGTITQVAGGWSFAAALLGPVTLTYEISDGAVSIVQKAYFNVMDSLPILGTAGDDTLVGTECANDIDGGCGDDNIDARGGNDTIAGGEGDDHIVAGTGGDVVLAEDGADIVFGGVGDDWISGGKGNDRLFGGEGRDVVFGDSGDDAIDGEAGDDLLFGGAGNDVIAGGTGEDKLFGEEGNDRLEGGADADILSGGADEDVVLAEAGDDTVIGDADQADDSYDGGEGDDLIDYSAVTSSVSVDLVEGEASGAEIGTDTIAGFEAVATGSGDDTVTGSDADEAIDTGAGDDIVADGGGSDAVDTGAGDDIVKAALDAVADTYQGGEGADTLNYSATLSGVYIDLNEKTATGVEIGTDQVDGFEAIVGGAGNDTFVVVSETPVSLTGGEGEDVFEFQAATVDNAAGAVVHDILDFMVGDRLKVDKYEIFEQVMDTLEDRFEDIYGDKVAEEDLPIRIRHEQIDDIRQTFIDVDFDEDDIYDMTINIAGDHVLLVVDTGQSNNQA